MAKKNQTNTNIKDRSVIIIRDVNKITRAMLEPCRDPETNMYPSCVRNIDDKGNMILSDDDKKSQEYLIAINDVIEIYDGKEFDLNNPKDASWWECIMYSPFIAYKGRGQRDANGRLIIDGDEKKYGTASFYVEVPGIEAEKNVSKKFKIYDAIALIKDSSYEEMLEKTRLLGNWMKNVNVSDIQAYLIMKAEENPDRIIEVYDSENISYELLVIESLERGVIRQDKGFFWYGNVQLGTSKTSVISMLKQDKNISVREAISKELYG